MNAISKKSRVVLRDAQFRPEREGGLEGDRAGVPQGGIMITAFHPDRAGREEGIVSPVGPTRECHSGYLPDTWFKEGNRDGIP